MANIKTKIIKGNRYYYLQMNNNGNKHKDIYLGKEPPWPRTQGWTNLTDKQIESIDRIVARHKAIKLPKPPAPTGQYRTIVIDPPWPVAWPKRLSRPNQIGMPYQTMPLDEIKTLPIKRLAADDGCHLFLWTTHGFLPDAFKILDAWDFKYKCLLTWVKNVGFTPFSFMLTTEFCLYGIKGNIKLLKLGKRVDFNAKVREHSRKPDKFFNLVKLVTPEPRLEMFAREPRKGFVTWGNEVGKFENG